LLLVLGAYETWKWAAVPADAPVIGVSLDTAWHARAGLSTKNYEICLTLVGARILEMRPGVGDPLQFLDRIDGLLLTGGGDVDPALYGGPAEMGQLVDRQRDDFEIALIRGALERDMPILGICRGVQILNVAHGGTLRSLRHDSQLSARHSVGASSFDAHQIAITPNSRLAEIAGAGQHRANSFHSQAVDRVGDGLRVVGVAQDGLTEALERPDRTLVVATQWHPEVPPREIQYFERLLEEAKRYRQRRAAESK
jgi:gamma-glutamyl-gamma-aminobutyrate hydrolase PuuD